uniref:Reverse transcriptase zinc-binding domain-containing protein n=1 Tax=Oryza brachyantha TaxID=4533 RepID=J3KXC4_ORYBR
MMDIWHAPCPLKIKHFLWLADRDRIQSVFQLRKEVGGGGGALIFFFCILCGQIEDARHIIFDCPIAIFMWCVCKLAFCWNTRPNSFEHFYQLCIRRAGNRNSRWGTTLLAAVSWSLWNTRNDMIFRNKIVSSPVTIIFRIICLLRNWRTLLKSKEEAMMDQAIEKLQDSVS